MRGYARAACFAGAALAAGLYVAYDKEYIEVQSPFIGTELPDSVDDLRSPFLPGPAVDLLSDREQQIALLPDATYDELTIAATAIQSLNAFLCPDQDSTSEEVVKVGPESQQVAVCADSVKVRPIAVKGFAWLDVPIAIPKLGPGTASVDALATYQGSTPEQQARAKQAVRARVRRFIRERVAADAYSTKEYPLRIVFDQFSDFVGDDARLAEPDPVIHPNLPET